MAHRLVALATATLALSGSPSSSFVLGGVENGCCNDGSPLQIFLLAGQSNMVGMGSIKHLKLLLESNETHDEYAHLWNETSQDWAQRDDVIVKFDDHIGPLKAGFGAPDRGGHLGVELEFGWTLGDATCCCKKPILLLKTAYGGRSLAVDFRPPSSGKGKYKNIKPVHYGWQYRIMIQTILGTVEKKLPDIVPTYNATLGYELAGFVWFQGWNDLIDTSFVKEYAFNLANLIRDVRDDLSTPDMPVIIGELGMKGLHPTGRGADRYMAMQKAERDVAAMPEFRNNTMFVRTAQYAVTNGTTYNGEYHYNGRADTYCHMGKAFGEGMLKLLNDNNRDWCRVEDERRTNIFVSTL